MPKTLTSLACTLIALAAAASAFADKVVLKNGRIYEGTITEQTETLVKIKTAKAALSFPMDQVASVEKGEWALGDLENRLSALDPSKPATYLEAARTMVGPGREGLDIPTLRRLCEIASRLDAELAYDAQRLFAKEMKILGDTRATSRAWRRALVARPKDAEAIRELEPLDRELLKLAQFQIKQLSAALDQVLCDALDQAAPKLRTIDATLMPEEVLRELKVPLDKFTADIRSRVRCKRCDARRILKCEPCQGSGEQTCAACKGKGRTPAAVEKNDPNEKFGDAVCIPCRGIGTILCPDCKATREVTIHYKPEKNRKRDPDYVNTESGKETEAIDKVLSPKTWRSRHDNAWAASLTASKAKGGGEITCPDCQGAVFSPPMTPIDNTSVSACRELAEKYAQGIKTWDPLGFEPVAYDQDVVRDECFRLQKGKWVK